MKVQKFGGSSLADGKRIKKTLQIVLDEKTNHYVVLSAMKGITNLLVEASKNAEKGNSDYKLQLLDITKRHRSVIEELFPTEKRSSINEKINYLLDELKDILHGVELVQECSLRTKDLIMSFGERLNCSIVAEYFNSTGHPSQMIDAREIIITDDNYGSSNVFLQKSYKKIKERLENTGQIYIITGFISGSEKGITTTLGRNGSDYTAAIIGAAMESETVEIWTDVDGVLTADPRVVHNSFVIPYLSIEEAMELSYFGAEVIHPYTLMPTIEKNIPVIIKNTLNTKAKGTIISKNSVNRERAITGIASIDNVSFINVEGGGMLGIPGIASSIFSALADAEVNIIMITQASSEHSICIVCRTIEVEKAIYHLNKRLEYEIKTKKINRIDVKNDLEIIAVIGENMKGMTGISGKLFSSLGDSGINILAIAQGSSERNISFVIESSDKNTALNTIHKTFIG
ncbi:MAG: aspartate kinase [Spirochaetaceae bacterium]|nr:aspartate kinase [Spirochaetaceae bacterium]